jgi:uncharacterized protein YkwD
MKKIIGVAIVILVTGFLGVSLFSGKRISNQPSVLEIIQPSPKPTILPPKTEFRQIIPKTRIINRSTPVTIFPPTPTDTGPWGVSKQIDEHTWTIRVGEDATMATPEEIFRAVNEYRQVHGSQILTWDEKLTNYAQQRAVYLNEKKNIDGHQGFSDFLQNQDGFNKLGFTALGENISYGYKLNGVHIIEWMYAGDKPHDDNQLDNRWNYVGIGVDGLATCLIFGTGKF